MKLFYKLILAVVKFFYALVKTCAIIYILFVTVVGLLRLCDYIELYARGYTDGALYSAANECVVNIVGVDKINEEAKKLFDEAGWETPSLPEFYHAPKDSSLYKVFSELQASRSWMRTLYCGYKALVLRLGCHYNYVWLVVVDPQAKIVDKNNKIRRIADNVGVCFDTGNILK